MKLTSKDVISIGSPTLFILLFVLWAIVNASLEPALIVAGVAVALAITRLFSGREKSWSGRIWRSLAVTPRALWHFLAYLGIFLIELVRANVGMLRYVYARHIDIHPGVVKVETRLASPLGRLALANSIALTPGSLVLGLEGSVLYVHWLDVRTNDREEATRQIVGPFEKHLEAAFG